MFSKQEKVDTTFMARPVKGWGIYLAPPPRFISAYALAPCLFRHRAVMSVVQNQKYLRRLFFMSPCKHIKLNQGKKYLYSLHIQCFPLLEYSRIF